MSKVAPLKAGFMLTSIIGFVLSAVYITKFSRTWAFTFGALFAMMFIASLISMQYGPPEVQLGRKKLHRGK